MATVSSGEILSGFSAKSVLENVLVYKVAVPDSSTSQPLFANSEVSIRGLTNKST